MKRRIMSTVRGARALTTAKRAYLGRTPEPTGMGPTAACRLSHALEALGASSTDMSPGSAFLDKKNLLMFSMAKACAEAISTDKV